MIPSLDHAEVVLAILADDDLARRAAELADAHQAYQRAERRHERAWGALDWDTRNALTEALDAARTLGGRT